MASEPKEYTIMILTSNTEATENKIQFLNLAYRVKGFQCHSNNSLQLLGRKKTTKVVVPAHNALTQLDMHLHRLTFAVV